MDDLRMDQKIDPRIKEEYFRYQDVRYASGSEEYGFRSRVDVELQTFDVIKHTEHGVWIWYGFSRKFVLGRARKKFAHPTIGLAKESFIARKKKQLKIYQKKIDDIRMALLLLGVDL